MRASPDGVARDSMDDQPAFIPLVVAATQVAWALLLWSFLRDNCYLRAGWPIVVGGLCVVPRAWAQDVLDTGGAAADLMVFKGLAPAWWLPVIRAMLIVGIVRVVLESKSRHAGLAMHQRKRVGGGGAVQPGELTIALEPAFSVPLGGGFAALVLAMARRKKVDVGANRMVAAPTVSLLGTVEERLRSCLEGVAALRAENERLRAWARNERKFDG